MNVTNLAVRIPILCLHRVARNGPEGPVPPEAFDNILKHIKEMGAASVSLGQVGRALIAGGQALPRKAVCICFDDCYADVLDHAVPILERHGFRASFFAVAGHLGGHSSWNQDPACRLPLMGAQDLRDLASAGHEIGSHGLWHCSLPGQNDQTLWAELSGSRKMLEDVLGQMVEVLAYPFGDVSPRVEQAVARAGYLAARSLRRGNLHRPASRFNLGVIKSGGSWAAVSRWEMMYRFGPMFNLRSRMEELAAQWRRCPWMAKG